MSTAINSLLGALRKAEEQHGEDRPCSTAAGLDKDLQRWTMPPANRLLGMDFADAEVRVGMAVAGKVLLQGQHSVKGLPWGVSRTRRS